MTFSLYRYLIIAGSAFILTPGALASPLIIGQLASTIILDGPLGMNLDGNAWNSDDIAKMGKVVTLFYVDPEEKKLNADVEAAYDKAHFPKEKHASIAVINMAAAWYPNSMINSQLKEKQIKFPRTIYVKDLKKSLVKEWDLQDDSVNVVVFGKDGKVLYVKKGEMNPGEISSLMALVTANL
jgi:uncharacterized protein